jgi:hypothetical protein
MSTTTAPTARYTLGQSVEVEVTDFSTPGFPSIWAAGTVTTVSALERGLWDIMVVTEAGHFAPQVVGKRGGNKRIREAA